MRSLHFTFAVLLAFVGGSSAHAASVTNGQGGASSVVTANYNSGTGLLSWTYNYTAGVGTDGRNWDAGGWLYLVSGDGVTSGTSIFDNNTGTTASNAGTVAVSVGQWVLIAARNATSDPGPSWWTVNPDQKMWFQVGAATDSTRIPFNVQNTGTVAKWYGIENTADPGMVTGPQLVEPGEYYTGTIASPPGDTSTYRVVEIRVDDAFADGGGEIDSFVSTSGTTTYDFSGYTSSASGTLTPSSGTAGPAQNTDLMISGTTVSAGSGSFASFSNPNAVTTTTPGSASTQGSDAANTNAITKAIGEVKQAVLSSSSGGGGTDMSGVHSRLDSINTNLQKMETKAERDAKIAAGQTAVDAVASSNAGAMSGALSGSVATAETTAGTVGTSGMLGNAAGLKNTLPLPTITSYADSAHVVATTDPFLSQLQLDTNPFTNPAAAALLGGGTLSSFAAWVRNITVWAIVVAFLLYVAKEVKATCYQLGATRPMPLSPGTQIVLHTSVLGNSVGVPAAGVMWAAATIVFSTFILAAPTLIIAYFSTNAGVESMITAASAAASAASGAPSFIGNALSYTNKFFPLVLAVTAMINGVLVQIAAITQWIVYSVGIKLSPL